MSTVINFNVFGALNRWTSIDDATAEIDDAIQKYNPDNINIEIFENNIHCIRVKVSQVLEEDFSTLSDHILYDTYNTILKISSVLQTIDVEGIITNDITDSPDCTISKQSNGVLRVEHSRVINSCELCHHNLNEPHVKMFPSSARTLESLVA